MEDTRSKKESSPGAPLSALSARTRDPTYLKKHLFLHWQCPLMLGNIRRDPWKREVDLTGETGCGRKGTHIFQKEPTKISPVCFRECAVVV